MSAPLPYEFEDLTAEEKAQRKELYTAPNTLMVDMVRTNPGRILLPASFKNLAERIYNFEVRPTDIFMVTYPKAGSTWTQVSFCSSVKVMKILRFAFLLIHPTPADRWSFVSHIVSVRPSVRARAYVRTC